MTWDASYEFLSQMSKPLLLKSASDCSLRFIITLTELHHDEVRQIGHRRIVEHHLGKLKGRVVVFHIKTKKTHLRCNLIQPCSLEYISFWTLEATVSILVCNCNQVETKIQWMPSASHRRRPVNGPYGSYSTSWTWGGRNAKNQLVWTVYDSIHQCPMNQGLKIFLFQNWCSDSSISWYFLHKHHHIMGVRIQHCWSFWSKWMGACQPAPLIYS